MHVYADLSVLIRVISVICVLFILNSCGKIYTPEQESYIKKIEDFRAQKNVEMKNDPSSPFNLKGKVEFHNLNYFDPDPDFVFNSKLTVFDEKDTVIVYGTKGEARKTVRYGYLTINHKGKELKINVYEGSSKTGMAYHSIWFTDLTTNKESYGVGRYINFELDNDPNYIYEVDFNLAYNPYCAYSPNFSCAIPTKEDFIPVEIRAGEKKFHD
ncbi:MAG: secreted protein [Ignavibacteria bacterium]|nr:MAG: secreted protein [Ignavibacteria bacterium]KAF0161370.1 MAG: secreted protein [Ignavibacteria bacterium]